MPRRALLSVSDKSGLVPFAAALVARGFELVSTGGTARALREAGLPVTDVAAVTGFPEMLDGRVKTLHPRVHGGILADRRLADHREQLAAAGIEPFELVVVNLYPFAAAAERAIRGELDLDGLVEEIDIGGPSMVRAAAKNHASVAIVTDPGRYDAVLAALDAEGGIPAGLRAALAVEAFRHTAAYDARIAEVLPERMAAEGVALPDEPGHAGRRRPVPGPPDGDPREGRDPALRREPAPAGGPLPAPGRGPADGPFATGAPPLQGKALSYNNVLDGSAAAGIGRAPARPGVRHRQAHQPLRRRGARDAWPPPGTTRWPPTRSRPSAASSRSPGRSTGRSPSGWRASSSRSSSRRPSSRPPWRSWRRSRTSGWWSTRPSARDGPPAAAEPDRLPPDRRRRPSSSPRPTPPPTTRRPGRWPPGALRPTPSAATSTSPGVSSAASRSNAIVLVRDGMLIGIGSGQTSRVDAARQAVAKATALLGADRLVGAACASDAFYPFPDAVEVCLAAGVTAFAQPGGSLRDADAIAAADAAGATMLLTGVRHFRH